MASSRAIKAGKAQVEIRIDDKLKAGLKKAQKRLSLFGAQVQALGIKLVGVGSAITAPFAASVGVFSKMGDSLDKMSKRTGFSVESLSQLGFAAEQSGSSLGTLEKGIKTMQRSINDAGRGLSTAVDGLNALGLSVKDFEGLSPEEQFKLIADRISQIEDPSKKAALAMQLFGRAGQELVPLLSGGSAGINQLQKEAESLGLTISTQDATAAANLTDTFNRLWKIMKIGVFTIGSALAPMIQKMADFIVTVSVAVIDWMKQNKKLVVTIFKIGVGILAAGAALLTLGTVIVGVGFLFGTLASIIGGVVAVFGAIGAAIAAIASPIGIAIAAVVGLGVAILKYSGAGGAIIDWLKGKFGQLKKFIGEVTGGISSALKAGDIQLAGKILWLGLKVVWETGVASLDAVWLRGKNFFISTFQKMWFGAKAAFEIGITAVENAWIETTAFLSNTWTKFSNSIQKIWQTAVSFVAKRIIEIQGFFDSTLDTKAAKEQIDQELNAKLDALEKEKKKKLADREEFRRLQREESQKQSDANLTKIGQEFEAAQKALDQATGERVAEAQKALDEARAKLKEAVTTANAEAGKTSSDSNSNIADKIKEILAGAGGIATSVSAKSIVRGSFNIAAIQGLTASTGANEQTAKNTARIADNTKRLVDSTRNGGLSFG